MSDSLDFFAFAYGTYVSMEESDWEKMMGEFVARANQIESKVIFHIDREDEEFGLECSLDSPLTNKEVRELHGFHEEIKSKYDKPWELESLIWSLAWTTYGYMLLGDEGERILDEVRGEGKERE